MSKLAVAYNVNIICGSLPEEKDGKLYNVSSSAAATERGIPNTSCTLPRMNTTTGGCREGMN